jgi:drug/metabolite transporter (DMT)-like permease
MPSHLDAAQLTVGVAAGLATALLSAVSYLVSRHHGGRAGGPIRLLVLAHALMGLACIPATALLWPAGLPLTRNWVVPLVGSAATYLAGQAVVFVALMRADASRVAPLLGLKIVMLAAITSCLPGGRLDARQWFAVALSVAAALLLQRGGGIPVAALVPIVAACLSFAISDLCIVGLIDGLQQAALSAGVRLGRLHAGSLAMTVTYLLCGAVAAIGLLPPSPLRPPSRAAWPGAWTGAWQYAATWLVCMVTLYACLGLVGAVFGTILQSTRGIMAIVIGAALGHLGWHGLETRVDGRTLVRRVVAAALMTTAIAIYAIDLT